MAEFRDFSFSFPQLPIRRLEDNIKLDRKEMECEDLDSSGSIRVQCRVLVNTVTNLRIPLKAANFLTI
jgi:hypothetical protein